MRTFLRLAVILAGILPFAACEKTEVREKVVLDSHADKYLWYEIYRIDTKKGDKPVVLGAIEWKALVSANPELYGCSASHITDNVMVICGATQMKGNAATTEEARETIDKHFERFRMDNLLVRAPKPAEALSR